MFKFAHRLFALFMYALHMKVNVCVLCFTGKENKNPEKCTKRTATKKRKTAAGQNMLVVTEHGGAKPEDYSLLCVSSTDTVPVVSTSPSRAIAPSNVSVSPSLCSPSISSLFSPSLSPLSSPCYDYTPPPPSPFIPPRFVLSGSAVPEAADPTRRHSELPGHVTGNPYIFVPYMCNYTCTLYMYIRLDSSCWGSSCCPVQWKGGSTIPMFLILCTCTYKEVHRICAFELQL